MSASILPKSSMPSRDTGVAPQNRGPLGGLLGIIGETVRAAPITLAIAVAAVAFHMLPAFAVAFEFSTQGTYALSRLLGCHLLHWSAEHLFWDVLMFAVFGYLCETQSRWSFVSVLLASALLIPATVVLTNPEIQSYRGLSGLDTALFAMFATSLAAAGWRRQDRLLLSIGACGIGLVSAKTLVEIVSGTSLFVSDLNFTPLPYSHLIGIVIGGTGAALEVMYSKRRSAYPDAE